MLVATPRQLQVLRAVVTTGGIKQAAHLLDLSERQVQRHLEGLRHANESTTTVQLAYLLGQDDAPFQQMPLALVA